MGGKNKKSNWAPPSWGAPSPSNLRYIKSYQWADQSSRERINIITLSQDNSEGLDDLQFNLGKIQVISKSISLPLKLPPKGQFMLFTGADKYCWRDCRECEKSREQVGRDLVEKVKVDNSAVFTFLTLLRKRERTIHHFQFRNMGLVEKVNEDYSPTVTFSTWVLLNVEKIREDNSPIFTFSTWTLLIVEKAKQDPCVSGS